MASAMDSDLPDEKWNPTIRISATKNGNVASKA